MSIVRLCLLILICINFITTKSLFYEDVGSDGTMGGIQ
jgi:hypothetical protein